MALFLYVGQTLDGGPVRGFLNAKSEAAVALELLRSGITLEYTVPSLSPLERIAFRFLYPAEVTRFTRQMAMLTKSCISVLEALELASQTTGNRSLQQIITSIYGQVRNGRAVAQAYGHYPELFDLLYIKVLEVGELSGSLDASFERLATYREQHEAVMKRLRSALVYPALVAFVALAVVAVLVFYIVPIFASMYANFGAELPRLTAGLVAASESLRSWLPWILSLVLMGITGGIALFMVKKVKTALHRLLLFIPGVKSVAGKAVAMRYCRTLGSLLDSRVDIVLASSIAAATTGNHYAEEQLGIVPLRLAAGRSLYEALEEARILPRAAMKLIASGEKTGELGVAALQAAEYYEKEVNTEIANLLTLLEPAIVVVLGAVVTFLLVALYLPLFDLVGTIK